LKKIFFIDPIKRRMTISNGHFERYWMVSLVFMLVNMVFFMYIYDLRVDIFVKLSLEDSFVVSTSIMLVFLNRFIVNKFIIIRNNMLLMKNDSMMSFKRKRFGYMKKGRIVDFIEEDMALVLEVSDVSDFIREICISRS